VAGLATAALGALWTYYAAKEAIDRRRGEQDHPQAAPIAAKLELRPSPSAMWAVARRNKNLLLLTLSYGAVGYFQYLFFYWMHY